MTDRYAVIGNPVNHSKSPLIHGCFARATAQDMSYGLLEATSETFANTMRAFRDGGARGLNVTLPFKLLAFALADAHSTRARDAGAANALKFDAGRIYAENFDGVGLVTDLQQNLECAIAGRRVLVLGAGGATRGIVPALLDAAPAELVIANRDVSKAQHIAVEHGRRGSIRAASYQQIQPLGFDLLINASSASLADISPPVTAAAFAPGCLAYDLAYGKGLTPFLQRAQSAGASRLADGLGMLVEQAASTFEWWRGVRPDTGPVIAQLTKDGR